MKTKFILQCTSFGTKGHAYTSEKAYSTRSNAVRAQKRLQKADPNGNYGGIYKITQ